MYFVCLCSFFYRMYYVVGFVNARKNGLKSIDVVPTSWVNNKNACGRHGKIPSWFRRPSSSLDTGLLVVGNSQDKNYS